MLHHIRETERMHQISAAVVGIHDMVKFCKIQQQHTLSDNKVSNMFSKHATTGQQYLSVAGTANCHTRNQKPRIVTKFHRMDGWSIVLCAI